MKTLKAPATYEEIIKKSRFIAHIARVDDIDSAMEFLEKVSANDATHNCWAYKIGDIYRFSDDGEPGGTAGRPMFMAIEQQGFDHVAAVVIRYFGGIKLGTGGLARAYGGITGKCLQHASPYEVQDRVIFQLSVPFEGTGIAYPFLETHGAVERLNEEYTGNGLVFTLKIVEQQFSAFKAGALDASRGTFKIEILKQIRE